MSVMFRLRLSALVAVVGVAALITSCALTSDLSGSLTGRVLSAGSPSPVPGAVIECEGVTTTADNVGYYSMDGLPPGDSVVYARAPGFANYSEVVNIDGSTLHDIYMETFVGRARVFGYVAHAMLGPIEGATVSLGDLVVVTDSLGFYEYENVEQVTYQLIVIADGYRDFSAPVQVNSEDFRYDVGVKKLASITLQCTADADIRETTPDVNFGAETALDLYRNAFNHYRFVVDFLLDVEDTAQPMDATLRLYNTWETGDTASARTILVARLLQSWEEMDVTWANMPSTTGASIAASTYDPRWYEVDVTSYFADWLNHAEPNNGLLIDTAEDHQADRFDFASREYAEADKRPHVVLEYAW